MLIRIHCRQYSKKTKLHKIFNTKNIDIIYVNVNVNFRVFIDLLPYVSTEELSKTVYKLRPGREELHPTLDE